MKKIFLIFLILILGVSCEKEEFAYKISKTEKELVRNNSAFGGRHYENVTRYYCSNCRKQVDRGAKICPYCNSCFSN